jgi:hypothetical protein
MDWTRHPVFFPEGRARPELITEMIRQVRQRLDERGGSDGGRLPLIVRVQPSVRECLEIGLDVASWVNEGLVDYVVPGSPSRFISLDIPVREWKTLVAGTGVELHASPDSAAPRGDGQATVEMYRAAASNYYAMGVDGVYVFNLFCRGYPLADDAYVILRDLSCPEALQRRDKLFMATRDNWRDDTDTLPVPLRGPDCPARIGIMVGDDLGMARERGTLRSAVLRLRLDRLAPEDRLEVALNGEPLELSGASLDTRRGGRGRWHARQPASGYERDVLRGPWAWLNVRLGESLPRVGDNLVTVRSLSGAGEDRDFELTLTDVDLAVRYEFCGRSGLVRGER